MVPNRNKLIGKFIGNISNSVIHEILEKAINDENIRKKYDKESMISFKIAIKYREQINPKKEVLPERDVEYIKKEVIKKVNAELKSRIKKGYLNIDLSLIDKTVDKFLKKTKIS